MPPMREYQDPRVPYQQAMPTEALPDTVIPLAIPADERIWVPQGENVWFRPLCFNRSRGYWMNLLQLRKSGVLCRHRHPQAVHGFVLKERWHHLEHDWVAEEGGHVFEPPRETHTPAVPDDVKEMNTCFQVNGAMVYVDAHGKPLVNCAGIIQRGAEVEPDAFEAAVDVNLNV